MRTYKRVDTWWIEFRHKGIQVRESAHTDKKAEADTYLKRRFAEVQLQMSAPRRDKLTFESLCELIREDYVMNQRRSVTLLGFSIQALARTFAGWFAAEITTDAVEHYKGDRLHEGKARGTVNRELMALSKMFRLAHERELIFRRPIIKLLRLGDNSRKGFVNAAQFYAIHAHLPEWFKDPAEWMFLIGWRSGATKALERRDYDVATRTLRMRSETAKNEKAIEIILPPSRYREVIEHAMASARPDCRYLFHRDGEQIGDWRRYWRKACDAAGLHGILVHDLRRSAVKNMRKARVPDPIAMKLAGFKTFSVYIRYGIVDDEELTDGLAQNDAFLAGAKDKNVVVPLRRKAQ